MNTTSALMTIMYKNEQKENVEFMAFPGFDQPMYYCDCCKKYDQD